METKHEIKTCPRCQKAFECKLNNPLHCQCAGIELSDDVLGLLQRHFDDCLCRDCLVALAGGASPRVR